MGNRENETALWLHNKLGSTDDLWSGRSICSQLTKERLQDIVGCFRSLQAHVKVKLLLSFLHIVRRNVSEPQWKVLLDEIIELACADRDQWVSTTGEILKTYPSTFLVNTTDLSGSTTFHSMYTELKKSVKKSGETHTLPKECVCLGEKALAATISQIPHKNKHFSLKRKPKSANLRAELVAKSKEIQSSNKKGIPISTIPVKIRRTGKRMDEEIASSVNSAAIKNGGASNTGFLKANTLSSFSSTQRNTPSAAMRRERGAKVIDISEMPPTGKEAKRRKKIEEQEAAAQAKKEKEEAALAEKAASAAQSTPDYAAGLGSTTAPIKSVMPRPPKPKAAPTTVPSYMPDVTTRLPTPEYAREIANTLPVSATGSIPPAVHSAPAAPVRVRLPAPANYAPKPATSQPLTSAAPVQPVQSVPQAVAAQPQPATQAAKKPLSLTKEQMIEAQEMFKNSNKVTRPEKALILGFMAGSRENPCPQQGHIVNIRLSEKLEPVRLQDNSLREMVSETFFQMNYQTGEWRRIKKFKEPARVS